MTILFAPIRTIAGKEFQDRVRNRWVLSVAILFAVFALVIAWFGPAQQGAVGFRGIEPTIASLTSLVIYLLPLIALILGFDTVVGERERGSIDLLISMPITRFELLIGKYAGLALALTASTVSGFGIAALVLIPYLSNAYAAFHYIGFIASSLLLGYAFLSIALLVSVLSRDRAKASGVAIGLWFLLVLVFDLVLLGMMVLAGDSSGSFIVLAMLANPVDIFRVLNIFSSDELRAFYGLATVLPAALTHPAVLGTIMLAWIVLPLALAVRFFQRG